MELLLLLLPHLSDPLIRVSQLPQLPQLLLLLLTLITESQQHLVMEELQHLPPPPVVMDFLPLVHTELRWVVLPLPHPHKPSGRRTAKLLC